MCSYYIRLNIVGRVLNRTEFVDVVSPGNDYYASRMLTRCSLDTLTALCESVHLSLIGAFALLVKVLGHISVGGVSLNCAYGSRLVYVLRSENVFNIFLCLTLIFSGKVKVNIRLLVCLESQEGFKWDGKALLVVRSAAYRTYLVRHVDAAVVLG